MITVTALALFTFLLGLYLGHRWGSHDARIEANEQKRRFQRLLRFTEPYIDADAEAKHWQIERNDAGEIIDLHDPPIRCGTPSMYVHEARELAQHRKSLH